MSDPVTAVVAGGQAVGSIWQGLGASAAAKTEAKQLEYQAEQHKMRGKQISHSIREQANEGLSSLRQNRADRNLGGDSRAAMSHRNTIRRRTSTNENASVLSEKFKQQQLLSGAAAKRRAAPFMVMQGISGAASSGLQAYAAI